MTFRGFFFFILGLAADSLIHPVGAWGDCRIQDALPTIPADPELQVRIQPSEVLWNRDRPLEHFEGPPPKMVRVPPETAFRARDEFTTSKVAKKASRMAEEVLIQDAVYRTRQELMKALGIRSADQLGAACVRDACGLARDVLALQVAESLEGLPGGKKVIVRLHQSQTAFGGTKHGFAVVEFPSGRSYLVDIAFRQFFGPDNLAAWLQAPSESGFTSVVGWQLRNAKGGNEIADTIIRDGYIELTPEVADLYAQSLRMPSPSAKAPAKPVKVKDYLRSTDKMDFVTQEKWRREHGGTRSWGGQP